jgi:Insertion element 4 transposase N-terminal/Transposase DDE domain
VPRAGWVKPQDDQHLSDHVALGVLTRTFPPHLVDEVIKVAGKAERRNRLLPARLVVYYVLAMALFSDASYEEVMRSLVEGLSWQSGWERRWTVPTKGAIFLARERLGAEPLELLFERACVPLATPETRGAYYRDWRLLSIDGTTLDLADTEENDEEFGRPGSGRAEGKGAFPQLRLVGLGECGTHALVAVKMGPYRSGEQTLAKELVPSFSGGTLVLADRGFYSFPLWNEAKAHGAELLWRTKSDHRLPVIERHEDGSYRSSLHEIVNFKRRKEGIPVRVVEYGIDDLGRQKTEDTRYRLLTTILDPQLAPAPELAALYAERWEFETLLDEIKSHQRGPRVVLRSKKPDGVRQEAYAYLCLHYAIRSLMHDVASRGDLDPDRVSFTRSLRAARRSVRFGVGTASHAIDLALQAAITEITRELLPDRRLRAAARVVKRKMSNYGVKRAEHRSWPRPTMPVGQGVRVITN